MSPFMMKRHSHVSPTSWPCSEVMSSIDFSDGLKHSKRLADEEYELDQQEQITKKRARIRQEREFLICEDKRLADEEYELD